MTARFLIAAAFVLAAVLAQPAWAQMSQSCQAARTVSLASGTDTQVVTPVAGYNVFVCDIEASSNGTNDFYLESATAASCGGTLTQLGTEFYTIAAWLRVASHYLPGLSTGRGNGLCVHTTASPALSLTVWYAQHP
jgi:hypothetical protein